MAVPTNLEVTDGFVVSLALAGQHLHRMSVRKYMEKMRSYTSECMHILSLRVVRNFYLLHILVLLFLTLKIVLHES